MAWDVMMVAAMLMTRNGTYRSLNSENTISKRTFWLPGMHHDERPLPEIIDGKGNKDEIPGMDDWFTAKVAHICIQGFPTGSAEDNRGEYEKTCQPVMEEVTDTEKRIECKDHRGAATRETRPGPEPVQQTTGP